MFSPRPLGPIPFVIISLWGLMGSPGKAASQVPSPHCFGTPPELYLGRPQLLIKRLDAGRVRLSWNAVPETNTQGYHVERSADSDHWTPYAYVSVSRSHRYRYDDTCSSAVFYRVVRLDFTRHRTASRPVRSSYGVPLGPLLAQPNPARGPVRLLGRDPFLSVDVLNSGGEVVHQIYDSTFNTRDLHPGVYALRQGEQITRFIVR